MSEPRQDTKNLAHGEHPPAPVDPEKEPGMATRTLSVIAGVLFILLFLGILLITYVFGPARTERAATAVSADERLNTYQTVTTEQESEYVGYQVLNAEDGIYKIPVERAMDILVKEAATSQRNSDTSSSDG
ncbi:MAG: hypothetical protein ACOCVG_03720 [Verrucomicrobiota bacterium]